MPKTAINSILDEMQYCVLSCDVLRFSRLRKRLVETIGNPLNSVFSVTETSQVLETSVKQVHRMLRDGRLEGRKSGKVWLVRL